MGLSYPQEVTKCKSFGDAITRSTKQSLQKFLDNCHLSKNLPNDTLALVDCHKIQLICKFINRQTGGFHFPLIHCGAFLGGSLALFGPHLAIFDKNLVTLAQK